jgi:medium-chain acyl-[acyl-carrier-protein] hydrolase
MYSFESRVRFSEVDESGRLSVPALFDYFQDCSLFQAESLGHGVTHGRESNVVWLLAAWKVQILSMPAFTDYLRVSTWASSFKGLFAHRSFTAEGDEGKMLARADSIWFLFNLKTGRPIRATADETDPYADDLAYASTRKLDMPPAQRRIPVEGEGVACSPIKVTSSHIDTNHHVNNAQYVAMAMGALSERGQKGAQGPVREPREIDVQYLEAARIGDVITPVVHHPLADPAKESAAAGSAEITTRGSGESTSAGNPIDGSSGSIVVALEGAAQGTPFAVVRVSY